jgi:methylase of polypeptide subunit release factors
MTFKVDLAGRWRGRPRPEMVEGYEICNNRGVLLPIVVGEFSENIVGSIRNGDYEAHEATELDALIQPGEIILEIGSGCGFISTYCAKNPNTSAVYCVEANPQLIDVIRLTHRVNHVTATVYNEILAREDVAKKGYLKTSILLA